MAASASSVWAVKHGPRFFALVAASIGLVGMAGWIFDIPTFQRLHPSLVTMKFNAAVCVVCIAAAVLLLREEGVKGARLHTARALAGFVWLMGVLTFIEHVAGVDLGIDQLLFHESAAAAGKSFPGRFGITSCMVFAALGTALLTLDTRRFGGRVPQYCVMVAALSTLMVFLYYFYGIEEWEWMARYVSIALHTVVAFLSLCAGILLSRPDRGVMRVMLGEQASGVIARRLLPAATLLPVVVGWLVTLARRARWFGPGFGSAMLVVTMIALFTAAIWMTVRALRREEARRRQNEEALRESEERFRTMADNISQFAWMTDADGYIFWYNKRWHEYTGTTLAEMQGWGWQKVQHPEHLPRVVAMWQEHLAAGEEWEDTFPLRAADGSWRWFLSRAVPMRDADGKTQRWFGTNTDVTEQRKAAEALARANEQIAAVSRAKDDFLAMLSHELRTPLTPVLMMAGALESDASLSADVREQLGMMRRNIELEARLIDDLLDLTRIGRGKLMLALEPTDVHQLIIHSADIVRRACQEKHLLLRLDLDAARHHALADATRLRQVFWNLLTNAVKFTPREGLIRVKTENDRDGCLVATVSDSGIGIAPESLAEIFNAFEQAGVSGKHRHEGLGLGLAISQAIVALHGGVIHAESDGPGRGASFRITLACTDKPHDEGKTDDEAPSRRGPLRLLLVDDHEATLSVLSRLLQKRGHTLTAASSMKEALDIARTWDFDVLVSDLGLPDGSGAELLRELRRMKPVTAIALSGYGMADDVRETKEAGFSAHLVKPVKIETLSEALYAVTAQQAASASEGE